LDSTRFQVLFLLYYIPYI